MTSSMDGMIIPTVGMRQTFLPDSATVLWDRPQKRRLWESSSPARTNPPTSLSLPRPSFLRFSCRSGSSGSWIGAAGRAPAGGPSRSTSCCHGTLLCHKTTYCNAASWMVEVSTCSGVLVSSCPFYGVCRSPDGTGNHVDRRWLCTVSMALCASKGSMRLWSNFWLSWASWKHDTSLKKLWYHLRLCSEHADAALPN